MFFLLLLHVNKINNNFYYMSMMIIIHLTYSSTRFISMLINLLNEDLTLRHGLNGLSYLLQIITFSSLFPV